MSSHHFVKEGQEPPLLILDPVPFDVVSGLLEWSPTVLVTGNSLQYVHSWGIKIDVVLIHQHELNTLQPLLADLSPVDVLTFDNEVGLFQTCFDFLVRQGQSSATIITFDAKELFPVLKGYLDTFRLVLQETHTRWVPVFHVFEKWVPANTVFHLWRQNPHSPISHDGLFEQTNGLISRVDGLVRLESEDPFWIGQAL